jgi:phage gpG-like protein
MLSVSYQPEPKLIAGQFFAVAADFGGRSLREPLQRSVREVAAPAIRDNFLAGGRPSWEPLQETSTERNVRYGGSGEPLIRSGKLMRKASQINAWTIDGLMGEARYDQLDRLGVGYGAVHQLGSPGGFGSWIPERPFVTFTELELEKMEEVFGTWVSERLIARGVI